MPTNARIVEVTTENLSEHPKIICFINPKHPHYHHKVEWLRARFREGLRIKLLFVDGHPGPAGYIEYTPGEACWRAVSAKGYLFVHCLWVAAKKLQHQGLGSLLLEEVERDAKGMLGVAAVTSDGPFMATRDLFLRNGYEVVQESGKDQLLVKQLEHGPRPSINDWQARLKKLSGMHIVYSAQCPWV
ncbi:MAG: GNAT family N-acetyltransferase, partial [Chitinivibrionales bacterium]|nr:GNAT family N-acetyltransferase [Chitinivibrionales bacterium]